MPFEFSTIVAINAMAKIFLKKLIRCGIVAKVVVKDS